MILYNFWQLVKDETKVKVSFYEGYELEECSLDFIVNHKKVSTERANLFY